MLSLTFGSLGAVSLTAGLALATLKGATECRAQLVGNRPLVATVKPHPLSGHLVWNSEIDLCHAAILQAHCALCQGAAEGHRVMCDALRNSFTTWVPSYGELGSKESNLVPLASPVLYH